MKNFIPSLLLRSTFLLCAINTTALADRIRDPSDGCIGNCAATPSSTSHLSDADRTKLTALAEERKCHIRLAKPFANYTQLFNTWLTNDTSKYFLLTNFRDFQARNDGKFAEIKKFATPVSHIPDTLQELADALKAKDAAYNGLGFKISAMNADDEAFLQSLNSLESGLSLVKRNLEIDPTGCQFSTVNKLESAKQEIKTWMVTIQKMRNFVTIAMRKRSTTAAIAYLTGNMQLKQAYSQKAVVALNGLDTMIDQIFEASRLLEEESNWYGSAMLHPDGPARGWAGQKLAYENALETLKADYVRGLSIQSKIATASITDDQKKFVGNRIDFDLKAIERLIVEIESGGWQKRLIPQKAITAKIISLGSQYPEACQQAANDCALSQATVTDLDSYRSAEKSYFTVVNICFARK